MVSLRKRPHAEVEPPAARKAALKSVQSAKTSVPKPAEPPVEIQLIRNNWHFANLCQWIYIFGQVVKISDDVDVDLLEMECLKPRSIVLLDIGLCLLKYLSSHRGLNYDLFDEYTRRQYLQKSPEKNPFGNAEVAASFLNFDVETKLRVLHQMTQWVMINAEKLRDRMTELKDTDHLGWRIEPYGWDSEDRTYYVLDDNRLYRITDAPPPPEPSKKKARRPKQSGGRSSKRRRVNKAASVETSEPDNDDVTVEHVSTPAVVPDNGLGGAKWECIAVTYEELAYFLSTIEKTRDENEKILRDQTKDHLLPILEKQVNSRKRKEEQRQRELESLAKMVNAKRSNRLAVKQEQKRAEDDARVEEKLKQEAEVRARKEEAARARIEKERDQRLRARERRMRERTSRRAVHEAELKRLESQPTVAEGQRLSGRRLQAEIERQKEALKALQDDDDWLFDCICGVHGQVDDGTHSLACERCNVWLHSKCVGVTQEEAEADDFQFICASCKRRKEEEEEARPRTLIKLKVGPIESDDSNVSNKHIVTAGSPAQAKATGDENNQQHLTYSKKSLPSLTESSLQSINDPTLPEAPPSPTKKSATLPPTTSGNVPVKIGNGTNGFSSAVLTSRHLHDIPGRASITGEDPMPRTFPETPVGKGLGHAYDHVPGSDASQRFMIGTPMSRGLPTPSGNNVLPPPGRASMSFEESLHGNLGSSPGSPAARDIPSSPLPPAEAGISPLKNSPVIPATQNGLPSIGSTSSILPPSVLAPLQREQILTPPVKMTEEQRRQSQNFQRLSSPIGPNSEENEEELR